MPRLTKKFLVFPDSDEIYKMEDDDDGIVSAKIAKKFDSLDAAKKEAIENLKKNYYERLEQINNLKYKDF